MATAQFIVQYDQLGKQALNIGYVSGDWADQSELQQVADNLFSNWAANIMPSLSFQTTLQSIECRDLDDVYIAIAGTGSATAGGVQNSAESINCGLVITKTDSASRRKGRWFLPGVPSDEVNAAGDVQLGWAANLSLQFQVSQQNLNPVFNSFMVNRHKVGVGGFLYANITSFGFLPIIGSQRGRRDN